MQSQPILLDGVRAPLANRPRPLASRPKAESFEQAPFPSTALPSLEERRLAWAVVAVSTVMFAVLVPFARQPLTPVWAFIPI